MVPGGAAVGSSWRYRAPVSGAMVIAVWWHSLGGSCGGWSNLGAAVAW